MENILELEIIQVSEEIALKRLEVDCKSSEDHTRVINARNSDDIRYSFFSHDMIFLEDHLLWFEEYLDDKSSVMFSIYSDGEYCGQVSLYNIDLSLGSLELGRLFLLPKYRGRGIMSSVILFIIEKLKENELLSALYLECKARNSEAINLYLRTGFSIVPSRGHTKSSRNDEFFTMVMEL